jgi:hypothetical protein
MWKVHDLTREEGSTGRVLLARERPIALALYAPSHDKQGS